MTQRYEIRLAGSGGQGLILAGIILAEAVGFMMASLSARPRVTVPRPGAGVQSGVVISDARSIIPRPSKPDVLLAMTRNPWMPYR